jgi:hypothetical protein
MRKGGARARDIARYVWVPVYPGSTVARAPLPKSMEAADPRPRLALRAYTFAFMHIVSVENMHPGEILALVKHRTLNIAHGQATVAYRRTACYTTRSNANHPVRFAVCSEVQLSSVCHVAQSLRTFMHT